MTDHTHTDSAWIPRLEAEWTRMFHEQLRGWTLRMRMPAITPDKIHAQAAIVRNPDAPPGPNSRTQAVRHEGGVSGTFAYRGHTFMVYLIVNVIPPLRPTTTFTVISSVTGQPVGTAEEMRRVLELPVAT